VTVCFPIADAAAGFEDGVLCANAAAQKRSVAPTTRFLFAIQ
jgi:hypothetical protein